MSSQHLAFRNCG